MANLSLIYRIAADISGLEQGVSKGVQTMQGMEKSARQLGAAIGSALSLEKFATAAKGALDATGRIDDLRKKVSDTAEAVQELDAIGQQSGVPFERMATAIGQMSNRLVEGDKSAVGSLETLGTTLEAVRQKSPVDAFIALADAAARIPDPMERTKVLMDLFGRSGVELLPMMNGHLAELREQVRQTGVVMSNDLVAKGDAVGDTFTALGTKLDVLKAQALIPVLELFLQLPAPIQTVTGAVYSMLPALNDIAIAVIAAGGPAAAFAMLSSAAGVVVSTLGSVGATIATLISGPLALVVGAVGAVVAAWYYWDEIVGIVERVYDAVKTWMVDNFGTVLRPTFALIKDIGDMFVAMGELIGAVAVKVVGFVATMVKDVTMWIVEKLRPIWEPIGKAIGTVVEAFSNLFIKGVDFAKRLYEGVKTWLVDRFVAIVNGAREKIQAVTGFFRDMYDKVVGNSYVPDMINRIAQEFGRLGDVMVRPAREAAAAVETGFSQMLSNVTSGLMSFAQSFLPNWANQVIGIVGQFLSGNWIGGIMGTIGLLVNNFDKISGWITGGSVQGQPAGTYRPGPDPFPGGEGRPPGVDDINTYVPPDGVYTPNPENPGTPAEGSGIGYSPRTAVVQFVLNNSVVAETVIDSLLMDTGGIRRVVARAAAG